MEMKSTKKRKHPGENTDNDIGDHQENIPKRNKVKEHSSDSEKYKNNSESRSRNNPATNNASKSTNTNTSKHRKNSKTSNFSELQKNFAKKLEGARFRTINEELYTNPSDKSFEEFQRHPDKFEVYHKGYREQAAEWPINPLHMIIDWIKSQHPNKVIVDMGCGEAKLAEALAELNTVHSFDLVAANDRVVACDMAHVPLEDGVADVVVFCLSLMGVNVSDFIKEAHRLLKVGGLIKIVEVRSRFENEDGINSFIEFLKRASFKVVRRGVLSDNKMFFDVEVRKTHNKPVFNDNFSIKSCLYKKR